MVATLGGEHAELLSQVELFRGLDRITLAKLPAHGAHWAGRPAGERAYLAGHGAGVEQYKGMVSFGGGGGGGAALASPGGILVLLVVIAVVALVFWLFNH